MVRGGIAQQPTIDVRLAGDGPWVYLSVEDTGIGVPADRLSAIFDPFVQVDTSHTRPQDGSGLGLTISRRLARLMNGDIGVSSEVGRGSTFTLWLPAASLGEHVAIPEPGEATRGAARLHGVAEVGEVLLRELGTVISAFVARLRSERIIPSAEALRFSQLADHMATYLADLAAVLIATDESKGQPTSLVSGASEIQRLIADRHGVRRARLGWSRETLAREWRILREEVERVVVGQAPAIPPGGLEEALALMARFLGQAEDVGARALARACRELEPAHVQTRTGTSHLA
jgi:hypothetical protein